jgi:hypothetical protein
MPPDFGADRRGVLLEAVKLGEEVEYALEGIGAHTGAASLIAAPRDAQASHRSPSPE